jgi:ribonuclease HII
VIIPTLNLEKELWAQGYYHIAGIDEAGRGSWAGPVVAAAVILPRNVELPNGLRDSKLLTPKRREELNKEIKEIATAVAVGECDSPIVEEKGIAAAAQMAMRKALRSLDPKPDFSLIDYFTLDYVKKSRQKAVVKGDLYCASISAASIVAKVYRDDLMRQLEEDEEFKVYQFGKHKGYGTKLHQEAIRKYGVCGIHRESFIPESLKF